MLEGRKNRFLTRAILSSWSLNAGVERLMKSEDDDDESVRPRAHSGLQRILPHKCLDQSIHKLLYPLDRANIPQRLSELLISADRVSRIGVAT
jgi:hypothetical protein